MMTADIDSSTEVLSLIEIDTIGEILNISMGAAATTMSVLLNRKVEITTPTVKLKKSSEFEYTDLEPAVGVEINYIHGLHGINQLIMRKKDVKALVGCLLGEEPISDDEELNDIHLSALGEIMNQMMGSSSTALATFFNKSINISPPEIFDPANIRISKFADPDDLIVTVAFKFVLEGIIDSQFITVFPLDFTKNLSRTP
jgi:flagellar motor switch protein FliN/FliY